MNPLPRVSMWSLGLLTLACASCATAASSDPDEGGDDTVADDGSAQVGAAATATTTPTLPAGTLGAKVVEVASASDLLAAIRANDGVYLHDAADRTWYYETGNYLLAIESFTQYSQELDRWIDFGKAGNVGPAQARVVGENPHGAGWNIPWLASQGPWPARADSAWVVGTETGGIFGMGGAPQGIPLGTEVFGSMQTYGGTLSTPFLLADDSPSHDSTRIRALFPFSATTLLGGHSAGSSAARRIALDVGIAHVWLYGTPNYSRGSGAYSHSETDSGTHHTMVAEVINNHSDPVTNCLTNPFSLVSLAWGTAKCHDYSGWDYQKTSPVEVVCP